MQSIMSNERKCYVCGYARELHKHHIFFGKNRKNSDIHGCWVYLCPTHHNMSNKGVHFDSALDKKLKEECQTAFEINHTREEFMQIFGKNYL